MITKTLIKFIIIGLPVTFYLFYTIHYTFVLFKNVFLTGRQRIINLVLIWLIPFIWILFLKTFFKSVPGSHQIKKRKDTDRFIESGLGILDDTSHYQSNDHH